MPGLIQSFKAIRFFVRAGWIGKGPYTQFTLLPMHSTPFSSDQAIGRTDTADETCRAVKAGSHRGALGGWRTGSARRNGKNWVCSAWRRQGLQGDLTAAYKSLMGAWREDVVGLFLEVHCNGMRGNRHSGIGKTPIRYRETFLPRGKGCPQRLWTPWPSRCSGPDCTWLGETW